MTIKDTHKVVKDLIESGFTEKQAETITSIIVESTIRNFSLVDYFLICIVILSFAGLLLNVFVFNVFRK